MLSNPLGKKPDGQVPNTGSSSCKAFVTVCHVDSDREVKFQVSNQSANDSDGRIYQADARLHSDVQFPSWVAASALHRICLDNALFLPSFPIPLDMSDLELEQAAMAPHRWIERSTESGNWISPRLDLHGSSHPRQHGPDHPYQCV